jgi:uncharacterized protein with GYD domain
MGNMQFEKAAGATYSASRRALPFLRIQPRSGQRRGFVHLPTSKEITMLTYVVLASFTEQGIKNIKETTKRADAAREAASKFGVRMNDIWWTQGQYDIVTLCQADSESAIAAFGLALTAQGNIRFQTLRAFTRDEMNDILKKLP